MKGSVIIFSRISDKDTKCKHKMSTKKAHEKVWKKREVIYIKKAVLKQFKTHSFIVYQWIIDIGKSFCKTISKIREKIS